MKKQNLIKCNDIERLLIRNHLDKLTTDEYFLMEGHLKSCEQCRGYQQLVLNLQNSMDIDSEKKLAPDPEIRKHVIQRMNELKTQEPGLVRNGWQYIKRILEYRIPVYQALFGLACTLLVIFMIKQISFPVDDKNLKMKSIIQQEITMPDQIVVINNLDIIDQQKIGRNVKEDSILAKYIVSGL